MPRKKKDVEVVFEKQSTDPSIKVSLVELMLHEKMIEAEKTDSARDKFAVIALKELLTRAGF